MEYKVELTKSAIDDLFDIYFYVAMNSSFEMAEKLDNRLRTKCESLNKMPIRGSRIKEIYEERPELLQIICNPYNIIYKLERKVVYVLAIIDGRRNLQEELKNRILR